VEKEEAIEIALERMGSVDLLLLTQAFELAHSKKSGKIRVPPHLVERFGEDCILSLDSTEDRAFLDPDAIDVMRSIPWKKGEVPSLRISRSRMKGAKKKKK